MLLVIHTINTPIWILLMEKNFKTIQSCICTILFSNFSMFLKGWSQFSMEAILVSGTPEIPGFEKCICKATLKCICRFPLKAKPSSSFLASLFVAPINLPTGWFHVQSFLLQLYYWSHLFFSLIPLHFHLVSSYKLYPPIVWFNCVHFAVL